MAKFKDGALVTINDIGRRYTTWKEKMIEKGFPTYISDTVVNYRCMYYSENDCLTPLYKVVSTFLHSKGSTVMVCHVESVLNTHIIKTDKPCHMLIGELGLTKYNG